MAKINDRLLERTTLDLDTWGYGRFSRSPIDKIKLEHIIKKIKYMCSNCVEIYYKYSWFKGFHVIIWCSKVCDDCRFHYDDQKRYFADITNRKPHERDVCWQKKKYYPNILAFAKAKGFI